MELTIGSNQSNDIILGHRTISREHARLEVRDDGTIVIKDQNSTNGVFVNGRRIRKTRIQKSDHIKLGEFLIDNDDFFSSIKKAWYSTKTDFTGEYNDLLLLFKEYEEKKNKILKTPWFPVIIRFGLGLIIILVLVFFPNLIPNDSIRIGLIMSVGIVSGLATTALSRKDKKRDKIDYLNLEYEDKLICPKCEATLLSKSLTYLLGRGRCINTRCDATYDVKKFERLIHTKKVMVHK